MPDDVHSRIVENKKTDKRKMEDDKNSHWPKQYTNCRLKQKEIHF